MIVPIGSDTMTPNIAAGNITPWENQIFDGGIHKNLNIERNFRRQEEVDAEIVELENVVVIVWTGIKSWLSESGLALQEE